MPSQRWKGFPKHWGRVAKSAAFLRVLSFFLNLRVRVWSVWKFFGLANGRLGRPEEAMGVSQSIGEGFPSQQRFKGFKLFRGLEGLERLEGLRAGKRQAWTPIRSHGCVALGCLLAAG